MRTSYLVLLIILILGGTTSAYAINITLGGSVFITQVLDMMGNKITNLGTPTSPSDAATKAYVDSTVTPVASNHTVSILDDSSSPGCESNNECFTPFIILIHKGDTIIWSNDDTFAHTVTSGNSNTGPDGIFDSSLFLAGTSYDRVFNDEGTFPYFCLVHPWMTGEVIVI